MDSYDGIGFYGNISIGKGGLLGYNLVVGVTEIETDGRCANGLREA